MKTSESLFELIRLIRSAKQLVTAFDRSLIDQKITITQWEALLVLLAKDHIRAKDVAAQMGIDPATMSKIVERLERDGWIRRVPNPSDERSHLLEVTAMGRRRSVQVNDLLDHAAGRFSRGISRNTTAEVSRYLAQMQKNISEEV